MVRPEIKRIQQAAEEVKNFLEPRLGESKKIKIISHGDADGISAAGIIVRALYLFDVPFTVQITRRPMNPEEIAELSKDPHDIFMFLDQGTSQLDAIYKTLLSKQKDVVVIDHHPGNFHEHPNLAILNPHLYGMNGAKDASASTSAYLVVEHLDAKLRGLVGLALAGAIGDRQHYFSGFTGVNEVIEESAVDLGFIRVAEGLKLIGRSLKPILECLRTSTRPYLPGLSGNPHACRELLTSVDIRPSTYISNLRKEEQLAVCEAIVARVGKNATNENFMHTLWGEIYIDVSDFKSDVGDLRELATVMDACSNLNKPEIGLAVSVGDADLVPEAVSLLSSRQEEMLKAMNWFVKSKTSIKHRKAFQYINCGEEVDASFVGEMVSLAIESGLVETNTPILALTSLQSGEIKISARGTPKLAMDGINLGISVSKAALAVGGFGGGHDVAAAARIQKERVEEFLTKLDEIMIGGSNGLQRAD
ncbi:MAG: DHH family phosphoesterase [Candidatus Hadarchaeales archaeon]